MSTRSGPGADDAASGSWASESLPMSVRRELLERELRKLGFSRRGEAQRHGADGTSVQQQQQPQHQSSQHPQASAGDSHGE